MDISKLLFSPVGRIGRQTYWTALVLLTGAAMMLGLVPFFGPLVSLVLLWPMACIVTKRLHDAGRAAWAVPVVALLCAMSGVLSFTVTLMTVDPAHAIAAFGLAGLAVIVGGFALMAAVLLFVLAGVPRGTHGANRFGAPEACVLTFAALLRATRI